MTKATTIPPPDFYYFCNMHINNVLYITGSVNHQETWARKHSFFNKERSTWKFERYKPSLHNNAGPVDGPGVYKYLPNEHSDPRAKGIWKYYKKISELPDLSFVDHMTVLRNKLAGMEHKLP